MQKSIDFLSKIFFMIKWLLCFHGRFSTLSNMHDEAFLGLTVKYIRKIASSLMFYMVLNMPLGDYH